MEEEKIDGESLNQTSNGTGGEGRLGCFANMEVSVVSDNLQMMRDNFHGERWEQL